jgi:hypothetical protein
MECFGHLEPLNLRGEGLLLIDESLHDRLVLSLEHGLSLLALGKLELKLFPLLPKESILNFLLAQRVSESLHLIAERGQGILQHLVAEATLAVLGMDHRCLITAAHGPMAYLVEGPLQA